MAISLSTSRQDLDPQHFLRGRPVLSGQGAGDAKQGFRGLQNETNHGYAVLTQVISSSYRYDLVGQNPPTQSIWTTTAATFKPATEKVSVELGSTVKKLKLTAVIKNGTCRLRTDQAAGAASATIGAVPAAVTSEVVLTDTTGVEVDVWIEGKDNAGPDFALYSYHIHEVRLLAGDIP